MTDRPIILGLLQNTWANNPPRVAELFERHPKARHRMIRYILDHSRSGRILRGVLGQWWDRMTWDEASPVITGKSDGAPPGDVEHVKAILDKLRPVVVVGFGVTACDTILASRRLGFEFIQTCHPTARKNVTYELEMARGSLDTWGFHEWLEGLKAGDRVTHHYYGGEVECVLSRAGTSRLFTDRSSPRYFRRVDGIMAGFPENVCAEWIGRPKQ